MSKPLSEMTLEELWELFPIFLTGHQDCWAQWYAEEAGILREILGPGVILSHVGSTAIEGIWAKPIIDILIEAEGPALAEAADTLKKAGYICMADSGIRVDFNKGYTPEGFAQRVFHLHLRQMGDNGELYFRDYLNAHPQAAKEYESLKLGLWKKYEHDRDGYAKEKTNFVQEHTAKAKKAYPGRYARPEALARETFPHGEAEGVLHFLADLREAGMDFERAGGYWAEQFYWVVGYQGEPVCFLLLNGTGEEAPMAPFTVWTDDSGSPWYEDGPLTQRERELCWQHADICACCGSCGGGTRKTLFGKEFENVCRTPMRFTRPDGEELALLEKLAGLRRTDIETSKRRT